MPYKDKNDNFYGYHKEGTVPTTKAYYDKVMARKQNTPEIKLIKAQADVDAVLCDISTTEAMYYMLQYTVAKIGSYQSDTSTDTILTHTGEDIISWGDRIVNELNEKIRKLRELNNGRY